MGNHFGIDPSDRGRIFLQFEFSESKEILQPYLVSADNVLANDNHEAFGVVSLETMVSNCMGLNNPTG